MGRWGQTSDALKRLGDAELRSCKNTIHHIHRTLRRNEGDLSSDSAGTQTILASMEEVEAEVRRIWGPLLQRQQRADRLKHALAALKRLSWALPSPDQQVVCCVQRRPSQPTALINHGTEALLQICQGGGLLPGVSATLGQGIVQCRVSFRCTCAVWKNGRGGTPWYVAESATAT